MIATLDSNVVGPCKDCGGLMLIQKVWWHRPDLRETYLRHMGYNLCATDYSRARRHGTLPEAAPKTDRRPRLPRVTINPVYPVECSQCGEIARVYDREAAKRAQERHREAHRRGEALAVAS